MSVKREYEITLDDGPESGQCSDDEIENFVVLKKSKKHKRRSKVIKPKKRKFSDSTSSSTKTEHDFFNPYSVDTYRFSLKSECGESVCIQDLYENSQKFSDDIIDETFNNLNKENKINLSDGAVDSFKSGHLPGSDVNSNYDNICSKNNDSQIININRNALYLIDKTGIESTNADLRYYLLDFGFSNSLASDVFAVIYNTASPEPEKISSNNEEELEDNEEEMFNDLPIIDISSTLNDYGNSYSPEPVNNAVESYDTNPSLSVSYAPKFDNSYNSSLKPINELIDPQAIPEVGPRDPRLNHNRQQYLKFNPIQKFNPVLDNNLDKVPPKSDENPLQINKEWEVTVADMVKTHLRLYLLHNDINKEEYKSILKRAVNKIISSGEKKLETDKISKFLHSYVIMMQKNRYVDSI